jgi:nicotinamide phosphoribosyltransferase
MMSPEYIYPATLLCDFYKISHREQYPAGTEKIYSTWTPRDSRLPQIDKVVAFGFQAFIKEYLIDYFNTYFFERPLEDILYEYSRVISATLNIDNPDTSHIKALHELGYLPLRIKAVKEGTQVPVRVPMLTVENTIPEFFWLTNYIETLMSCSLWQMCTSATLAKRFQMVLKQWASVTGGSSDFVPFQGHDFSMRGMGSLESAKYSAAGHLLSFVGTDSIPGILFLEDNYGANVEKELVGTSIPATEHSVMCAYGQDELESYRNIITNVYPKGFVSIVSDTWDLWNVLTTVIATLKPEILAREGKVVVRPDSGDPVRIICGDPLSDNPNAVRGVIEILWDIFGGTVNEKGYKELDPHIGAIYGDAITIDRCIEICRQLEAKGFASTNMVYGIGSFTYQYNTRDTFSFALKSTYARINGEERMLFKNPVTDSGIKKSQKGMVTLFRKGGWGISYRDGLGEEERNAVVDDLLEDVFVDGALLRVQTLAEIRWLLNDSI